MAGVIKVNGLYHKEELISRDLFFKEVSLNAGADFSRALLEAIMTELHLTSTIEVIGHATTTEDFNEAAAANTAADVLLAAAVTADEIAYATQLVAETEKAVTDLGAVATLVNVIISGADVLGELVSGGSGNPQTDPDAIGFLLADSGTAEIINIANW